MEHKTNDKHWLGSLVQLEFDHSVYGRVIEVQHNLVGSGDRQVTQDTIIFELPDGRHFGAPPYQLEWRDEAEKPEPLEFPFGEFDDGKHWTEPMDDDWMFTENQEDFPVMPEDDIFDEDGYAKA
jgi:hypothetical protein